LSNLAQGKNYDWYFTIGKDDKRHKFIRELIRDPGVGVATLLGKALDYTLDGVAFTMCVDTA
jgi:hypothetical protein